MLDYRVFAVLDNRIVAALVEHSELQLKDGSKVHTASYTALIGEITIRELESRVISGTLFSRAFII